MKLQGIAQFINAVAGQKKDGGAWYRIKFLDDDGEEFFVAFVEEDTFRSVQGLPKKTPVQLTLDLVPGQKYFSVDGIETLD